MEINTITTKGDLKTYFKTGKYPDENQFSELIDSYWHKEENIPLEQIDGFENISLGYQLQWSPIDKKLSLADSKGNLISEISLQALDNASLDLRYNSAALSLDVYNTDNELLYSIPIADFVKNLGAQVALNSNTLQLKDSQGNIVSGVNFNVSNIGGLQTALDAKLTIPSLTDNYVGKWSTSSANFVNGTIQDDGTKVGIGVTPNTTANSAQLNFNAAERKVVNIPRTGFLSSYTNDSPNNNQQIGDIYNNGENLFWLRSNSNLDRWKKLVGFDVDFVGQLPTDFNSLKTTYSDSIANANFDLLDKYGYANIWTSNYCYGQKLTVQNPGLVNADSRMYEGVLTNINTGMFWFNGAVQQYQDIKGNLFLRGVGTDTNGFPYSEGDWKKVLTDNNNKTTTLGSENTYPNIKWAVDSTTQAALIAPRMTQVQRLAILLNTTQAGAIVYQTDGSLGYYLWNGTSWQTLGENIASADLTNTKARVFTQNANFTWDTLGNPYYLKGLGDQTGNLTQYNKVLRIDPVTKQVAMGDSLEVAVTIPDNLTINAPAMNVNYTVNHVFPDPVPSLPQNLIDLKNFMATIATNQYKQIQDSQVIFQKIDTADRGNFSNGVAYLRSGVSGSGDEYVAKCSFNLDVLMPHDKNWVFVVTASKSPHYYFARGLQLGFARTSSSLGVQQPEIGTLEGHPINYGFAGYGINQQKGPDVKPTVIYTKVGEVLNITVAYNDGTTYSVNTDAQTFLGDYRFVITTGDYYEIRQYPSFSNIRYYIAP